MTLLKKLKCRLEQLKTQGIIALDKAQLNEILRKTDTHLSALEATLQSEKNMLLLVGESMVEKLHNLFVDAFF
jgi:hypothetical protein